MKKIIAVLILMVLVYEGQAQKRKSTVGSGTATTTPSKIGSFSCPDFRDMKWGTHRDSVILNGQFVQFNRANNKSDTGAYQIQDDNMVIGTVACRNIYYYFNSSGRLNRVKLIVPKAFKGEMKYILTSKFEEPTSIADLSNGYQSIWSNIEEVRLMMTYFDDPVDFLTVEFSSEFELNESKKINRAVDDF